ncbi:kinase-like domain-containing protein [Chaetomidium leptoderma]|uniref:non-specific serine/threonine protein kinase n=1 Tax=Chaetomidium leptoderma TaxID=669021 RepID=A0AAN6VPH6_9PEZI|nr:kinase-like domain-containing protein [Chaetomidium leptoderma]
MDSLGWFQPSNLLHTQEVMRLYRPGGFHPVRLGDTFKDGRYTVHHKLGWGGFSTVWLAQDESLEEWVALKIITADTPTPSRELQTLQDLHQAHATHRTVQLLDSFVHEGDNGSHQCLVFELLGPTVGSVVADYHMSGHRMGPATVMRITRQLLQGLVSLHRAGYAHGDISGFNLAFTARKAARLSTTAMLELLGAPKVDALVRFDGAPLSLGLPEDLVEAARWDRWFDEDEEDIRLIDLGEAFAHGAEPDKLAQPAALQVPEKIFTGKFDYRVDLWRAGCTIYTLALGSRPFHFFRGMDSLVAQMIHFVEDLPVEWLPEWERMKEGSVYNWAHIPDSMPRKSKLEVIFERGVPEESLKRLFPIIQGLMRFRPEERMSAEAALRLLDERGQQG